MREIILDTETTGLSLGEGHRIVEIGAIEIINRIPTGRRFQVYLNPERDISKGAEELHGLSGAFLRDKPVFKMVVGEFMNFIEESILVIHNASFDLGFLHAELARIGLPVINMARVVDTVQIARRKHPNLPNSLDALCERHGVDNSRRMKHGALLDAELLFEVYTGLLGIGQTTSNP